MPIRIALALKLRQMLDNIYYMSIAITTFVKTYQINHLQTLLTDLSKNLDFPDTEMEYFIYA